MRDGVRVAGDLRQLRPLRAVAARSPRAQPAARRASRDRDRLAARRSGARARRRGRAARRRRRGSRRRRAPMRSRARATTSSSCIARCTIRALIAANDWASLRAAASAELELPRDLRPKNAYNLIRLLDLAIRWLARRAARGARVATRSGRRCSRSSAARCRCADVMALARELTPKLEAARQTSPLPTHADVARAERVLRAARDEAARRWLARAPGPWGARRARAADRRRRSMTTRSVERPDRAPGRGRARRSSPSASAERKHLVVYLSGAHAYGFPSPDSDLDLKCVHIAPTARPRRARRRSTIRADRIEVVDGVELDYGSNELAPVLRGAIKGNGNFLERILGELVLGGDRDAARRGARGRRARCCRAASRATTAASRRASSTRSTTSRPRSARSTCCARRRPAATCSRTASSSPTSRSCARSCPPRSTS